MGVRVGGHDAVPLLIFWISSENQNKSRERKKRQVLPSFLGKREERKERKEKKEEDMS